MTDLVKILVDGKEIEVPRGMTVLQACELAGAEIPRFCYHERLSIAGNCRMCLVEPKGAPKPAASCAMSVGDLRPGRNGEPPEVLTQSPKVVKAREGVLEFLLINHPLDCPICDQGGECDLQDQTMAFGLDHSRYLENKRAVEDKYVGPLVKTIMTRCIHCTRCIRFATEIGGVPDLGAGGRGEDMEITTYLEQSMKTELSGNVIDLCPVGALTSKPYAFNARPWELKKTQSVDVMDAVGSAVRVDSRGRAVLRFLPRLNESINEEWIADKTRFVWDGLASRRLDKPYVRENGKLRPATWGEAFAKIREKLAATSAERVAALSGDLACAESQFALKLLMGAMGSPHMDCRQDGAFLPRGPRAGYLFNTTIAGIEQADALLIIGSNPRWEAPMLNARIRKRYLQRGFRGIGVVGEGLDLTYRYDHLGTDPQVLKEIAAGTHPFHKLLEKAERPMLILGQGALSRPDGEAVYEIATRIASATGMVRAGTGEAKGWNGFNVLHTAAARVAGLDIGFLPGQGGRDTRGILAGAADGSLDVVYLLGVDEIDTARLGNAFVIYQGSHGDRGAHRADVILPGAAYTEKNALWVNTEGRVQRGLRAIFPPGEAREDWAILRALSEELGHILPFNSHAELRKVMQAEVPAFLSLNAPPGADTADPGMFDGLARAGSLEGRAFQSPIADYYLTNPIARASATMRKCSDVILHGRPENAN